MARSDVTGSRAESPRVVALCGAKDCRTRPGHAELTEQLVAGDRPCQLIESRCLDICSGPVIVVGYGEDDPRVFRRVRTAKQRRDVLRFVNGSAMSDRLKAIRVSGKKARRALARVRPR